MKLLKPISDKRLKPCPFCGVTPNVLPQRFSKEKLEYSVFCMNLDCKIMPETGAYFTIDEAVEAWNKRA